MKPNHCAVMLAALLTLSAAPAIQAAQYQLMIYETPAELAKRSDQGAAGQAYWKSYADYGDALKAQGILRSGAPLQPAATARTVTVIQGKHSVTARPAATSKTELGGYFVIDVATPEEAIAWAAKAPSAKTGGAVEVRPLFEVPGMMSR